MNKINGMVSIGASDVLANLPKQTSKEMPVLFIGHGSPMNGIEKNEFSINWNNMAERLPKPTAILCISAHWLTRGTYVTAMDMPRTIHDFRGFPNELYEISYPAPGYSELATETVNLIKSTSSVLDYDWGLDHGTWSVLRNMYPNADIPVVQLSIDYSKPPQFHYKLGEELIKLRKKGVLIVGSGNMVHNLGLIAWDKMDLPEFGYDWAYEINDVFKKMLVSANHTALIHYERIGLIARKAIPSPDHFYPLLYTLGLSTKKDEIEIFNDKVIAGSLTMTSVKFV